MRPHTALLFKEWIKLRRFCWLPPLFAAGALFQTALSFKGYRAMHGAVAQYAEIIGKEPLIFAALRPALIGGGICFALMQFLPDCAGRRLRLTFHLPLSGPVCLRLMTGMGLLCCALTFALTVAAFAGVTACFGFPPEIVHPMLLSLVPWGAGMGVAYCATAAFLAEPSMPRKLAFAAAGAAFVTMLTPTSGYGAGHDLVPRLCLCLLWIPAVEAAALRVKEGKA